MKAGQKKNCVICGEDIIRLRETDLRWKNRKYCGFICFGIGQKGRVGYWLNKKRPLFTQETRQKMSVSHRKVGTGKWMKNRIGEKSNNWKGGISKDVHSTNEPRYKKWRMEVFIRDGFKCRINNEDCLEKPIQAHHILRWSEHVELRYEVNNGITLCLAHHPRKRAEEKRLVPIFQELVSVSKEDH